MELSLYIHIPFCRRKCKYCDFLSFPAEEKQQEAYIELLLQEIHLQGQLYPSYKVDSIFIGGGTPSILPAKVIRRILEAVRSAFCLAKMPEITIEVNPGTAKALDFSIYREAGINRLSIGLQTVHNEDLALLGRIHTYEDFLQCYAAARAAGFSNINVDLITGIPGQTLEKAEQVLEGVASLSPEHISVYSLIIEENTPFYEMYPPEGAIDEELDRQIYEKTGEILETYGYQQYEISNYAKAGFACRHNIGYWTRHAYLGLGLGAASLVHNIRWKNPDTIGAYQTGIEKLQQGIEERAFSCDIEVLSLEERAFSCDIEVLTLEEQMAETAFLGLRMNCGINRTSFAQLYGKSLDDVYGDEIRRMKNMGLLTESENRVYLTKEGRNLANYVMSEFLP